MNLRLPVVAITSLGFAGLGLVATAADDSPATPSKSSLSHETPAKRSWMHKYPRVDASQLFRGKVESYDPATKTLKVRVGHDPIDFAVNKETRIRAHRKPAGIGTLVPGTAITVFFANSNGHLTAREILIKSGSSSVK